MTEATILAILSSAGIELPEGILIRRMEVIFGQRPNRGAIHNTLQSMAEKCLVARLDRERIDSDYALGMGPRNVSAYTLMGPGEDALVAWIEAIDRIVATAREGVSRG